MPLDKSDDMGDWIKDFYKSDAPQFKGKSKEKRRQMAIAAKLSAESLLGEADITISEKRAFILAARQAFVDGKKTFVFKEKEYKCTVKEDDDAYKEMADYLRAAKEATDDSTGDNVDDGEAPSPDIEDDELEKATDMAKQRYQKFGYEDSDVTGQALPEKKLEMPDISDRGTAGHKKFVIFRAKLYRKLKIKTKGEKYAVDDLLTLFDPNQIMKAQKHHPSGFKSMLNKMYPRENKKLGKGDFTAYDVFIDSRGKEVPVKEDKELPPHTDIQESAIGDKLMDSSDGDSVDTDIIRQDPMKFHNPKFGKPIVAHCYDKDDGHFDFIFFSDGKYVLGVPGHRQNHPGRYPSPDEEAFIFALKKSSYNDFKREAMSAAKSMFNSAPMKVLKFDTKIRDFKGKAGPNDPRGRGMGPSQFKIDRIPKTTFREEVEYHDRESMPSAVDDAADVMSSYTKFLKSTKSYY